MRFQRKPNPELRRVLRDNARQLRRASAPAEVKLWSRLRAGQIGGNQFRRQHRIGSFIVDFYCAAHHLVIELDGSSHDDPTQVEKDDLRVQEPDWRGLRVVRFSNAQIYHDIERVVDHIAELCGVKFG